MVSHPVWRADVCGAVGCSTTDGLLLIRRGPETRVLCDTHAVRWIRSDVGETVKRESSVRECNKSVTTQDCDKTP
jgi:hypothetical protein